MITLNKNKKLQITSAFTIDNNDNFAITRQRKSETFCVET